MGASKEPHGGELKNLYLSDDDVAAEQARAGDMKSWDLTTRQVCDLELILNGGFSPLEGFMTRSDFDPVVSDMRLGNGVLWPIPVTLDVTDDFAASIETGDEVALRDAEGVLLATMKVQDRWTPDKSAEARGTFGSTDEAHPGVNHLLHHTNPVYIGGPLRGVENPVHYDFKHLRDSPQELRDRFEKLGWRKVVAFQTRNPMHRAHHELTIRASREAEANLLIHPVVGITQPGDIDHFTRVRCYEHILDEYPDQTTALSLLPLAMRMAGPREAVWHAIIRKNFGCTHIIIGHDHAGPKDDNGDEFYEPYAAQELMTRYASELDITMVPFKQMVYVVDRAQHMPSDETSEDMHLLRISNTEMRRRLAEDLEIEDWFSYPKVLEELRQAHPPRNAQGFTVFFTGLSGSGKSTVANALMVKLLEMGDRRITLLDGDLVRKNLSSELGFSKEHRDLNIKRIGYVASEITKNGGIAVCAPIAPYAVTRREVREMISPLGGFIEVHVDTPLEVCEQRDRKGLYKLAREGKIKEFTGVSDPYETPANPEMVVDTSEMSPDLAAHRVIVKLKSLGYIR